MIYQQEIAELLETKYRQYAQPTFIQEDPISIPKQYTLKEDIEIAGFLTALFSWGRRSAIIAKSQFLMQLMEQKPFDFVTQSSEKEYARFEGWVYRTFNASDLLFILSALKGLYRSGGGLEKVARVNWETQGNIKAVIHGLRNSLLSYDHLPRSVKHLANPMKGSAAKRINMFLRWMIRDNTEGVDFGLWSKIPPAALMCPLDVHSARVARKMGLLSRKQNDWKAVVELTENLRYFDADDPVKYDFALFGLGVYERDIWG